MHRFILSVLLVVVLLSGSAFGDCPVTLKQADQQYDPTMDYAMVWPWCTNQVHINNMWYGLRLDWRADYWWSIWQADSNYCNPYNGLTRLFNAAWFMLAIQWYRDNDTLPQVVTRWWDDFIIAKADDSYAYTCTDDYVARNYVGGDTYLSIPVWLTDVVAKRSGTLVHEAVHHDGPSHDYEIDWGFTDIEGNPVPPYQADLAYGLYNSYSYTVYFLMQAIDTFLKDAESNRLIIQEYDGNRCGFIPFLNQFSFDDSRARALDVLEHKFLCSPLTGYVGTDRCEEVEDEIWRWFEAWEFLRWYGTYGYEGGRWPCEEVCNTADYRLPDGKYACDEEINDANASVNLYNQIECSITLSNLPEYPTLDEIRAARENFANEKQVCTNVVSDKYLEGYCSRLIRVAASVDDLEALYTLDDDPNVIIPDYAFEECVARFCQERYDQEWKADARDACYEWDDPLGCLDELCGRLVMALGDPDAQENYFNTVQCRRHYVEFGGSVEGYFDRLESMGKCEGLYTDCINDQAFDEWLEARTNGECSLDDFLKALYQRYALKFLDDIDYDIGYDDFVAHMKSTDLPYTSLGECEAIKLLCEQTKEFNAGILSKFVAAEKFPSPGSPVMQSAKYLDRVTKQLADNLALPDASGLTAAEALKQITQPENLHALSKLVGSRDAFFAVLGAKGFEKVFGSNTASYFETAEIQFHSELSPAQEELVPALAAHKKTRERAESEETGNFLKSIAQSDPGLLFNFMRDVHYTHNIDDVNMVLDELSIYGIDYCE